MHGVLFPLHSLQDSLCQHALQTKVSHFHSTILPLKTQPRAARVVIEGAWGAAFQWIAFGCETKYQKHLNNHTRLGRFLRSLGETAAADWWEALDLTRQAGWYGGDPDPADAHKALSLLEQIRLWATQ